MLFCGRMNFKSRLRGLIGGLLLLISLGTTRPAQASGPHYVFAHYMVCYALYGQDVQGFQQEIKDAQAAGIDGFALDAGIWNGDAAWHYRTNVEMMYEAAESLNSGFKLFFSVDMNLTNDIIQMVSAYANRPNSFYYNGQLVLSTFLENGFWWTNAIFQPLRTMGISNIFFIPFFNTENEPWPTPAGVSNVLTKYSFINGQFEFAGGCPSDIVFLDNVFFQGCTNFGKLFMAGAMPNYWGCNQQNVGRPFFESQGGEGIITEWNWIIQNQPDWVEITTWNDLNESTYVNPLPTPDQYYQSVPKRYSHAGYLELTKRYISWYKTGQPPPINQDALYYYYRIHSTNCIASDTNDVPVSVFLGGVQDVIYNTVLLTAPANLEIISGTNYITNSLPAGLSNLRTPFAPGSQQFTLRRTGREVLTVQGPNVLSQITNYDYFPATGYAYPPNLTPPGNLHQTTNSTSQ